MVVDADVDNVSINPSSLKDHLKVLFLGRQSLHPPTPGFMLSVECWIYPKLRKVGIHYRQRTFAKRGKNDCGILDVVENFVASRLFDELIIQTFSWLMTRSLLSMILKIVRCR